MATPRRNPPRRLGEGMRRKLEVTSAMAWEALVDCHVEEAMSFVALLAVYFPVEDALPRYLGEMDLGETMSTAIRTRVLMRAEEKPPAPAAPAVPTLPFPGSDGEAEDPLEERWSLLRQPRRVVRGVMQRQRRNEEIDRITLLSLARAEEHVIQTHVENAISFVALLEDELPLDRCVQQYLGAVGLAGGRAQTVFQRTMARLADVHLPHA
jgi:hypothetical protein